MHLQAGQAFGIVHVHLATEGADLVTAGITVGLELDGMQRGLSDRIHPSRVRVPVSGPTRASAQALGIGGIIPGRNAKVTAT